MKGRNPHDVYLSRQTVDIFIALHTCAAGSKFALPLRYDADRCMSKATLNRVTQFVAERAKAAGLPLEPSSADDLRRTCVVSLVDRLWSIAPKSSRSKASPTG